MHGNKESTTFEDNPPKSNFTSKFLVGADGSASTVRKLLSVEQEDLDYNRDWVVVDVKLKEPVEM